MPVAAATIDPSGLKPTLSTSTGISRSKAPVDSVEMPGKAGPRFTGPRIPEPDLPGYSTNRKPPPVRAPGRIERRPAGHGFETRANAADLLERLCVQHQNATVRLCDRDKLAVREPPPCRSKTSGNASSRDRFPKPFWNGRPRRRSPARSQTDHAPVEARRVESLPIRAEGGPEHRAGVTGERLHERARGDVPARTTSRSSQDHHQGLTVGRKAEAEDGGTVTVAQLSPASGLQVGDRHRAVEAPDSEPAPVGAHRVAREAGDAGHHHELHWLEARKGSTENEAHRAQGRAARSLHGEHAPAVREQEDVQERSAGVGVDAPEATARSARRER